MVKTLIKQLFFIVVIALSYSTYSQNDGYKELPFKQVISIIENRYNVSFSYADKVIKNKYITPPSDSLKLSEALSFIEEKLEFKFKILNDRFIVIKERKVPQLSVEKLNEVVVTGYLTTGISKKLDGSIEIETKNLGVLPGLIEPDVLQTVKAMPGVVSTNESISNLNIRGGSHDQNLILFDDIRMYQTGHFFGLISVFNPHLKHNITLSKSGTAARYGEGVSSLIDIKLPNKITNDGLKVGAGVNMLNADITTIIPITKNTELQFAARRSITDFLNTPTYDKYFERAFQDSDLDQIKNDNSILSQQENFKFHDVYGKFIWDINRNNKLKIVVLNIENELSYQESLINFDRDQEFTNQLNQNNITSGITYDKKWNDNLTTKAHAYYTNYKLASNNADILNQQNLIQENRVEDNGAKLDADYKINNKVSISSGYQFSQVAASNLEDVDNPNFRRFDKEVLITHAVFSSLVYSHNKVALKAGVRANYFEKFKRIVAEPRLSFNYKINTNFSLEVTGDLKSQSISQIIDLQNDFLGVEKKRWVLADDNETPLITSKQAALGLYYKKNNLLISGETYYKTVDGVSSRSQGFQNQFQFEKDTGGYRVIGADFLVHKKMNKITAWVSYSFMKNNYLFDALNNSESFPNNIDIRNIINFSGTYSYKNFNIALGVNWHSGNPFTDIVGLNAIGTDIEYQEPNSSLVKEFLRLDSSIHHNFIIGKAKAKLGISIWNILNNENVLNTYYTVENNELFKVENASLGITPNASFRLEF